MSRWRSAASVAPRGAWHHLRCTAAGGSTVHQPPSAAPNASRCTRGRHKRGAYWSSVSGALAQQAHACMGPEWCTLRVP